MPIYPEQKTFKAGFYNNSTELPRRYNALDVRKPYDTVFSDGLMPDADGTAGDTLKVTATSGMGISVATGFAKLGGAWFENNSAYNITLDAATGTTRYDCVIINNDDRENVKAPEIYVKSLSTIPTIYNLTRNDYVYEVCIAYIKVDALATMITDEDITDTRLDGALCNVMSGVGAMVVRTYNNSVVSTTANQRTIAIGIPQYNRSRDTLIVAVEGRVFTQGVEYTITNNTSISFVIGLPVIGTKVDFQVIKNVNASGAETVVQEVAQLTQYVNVINQKLEYDYICNGVNDNIQIGNLVRNFLTGGTDRGSARFNIIGTIGMTVPAGGSGTAADPYYWFNFNAGSTREVTVDFSRAGQISPTITNGTTNNIFHSNNDIDIVGANVVCSNNALNTTIRIMSTVYGVVYFEKCRFWITGYKDCLIAYRGTFTNCRGSVANSIGNSYCFLPATSGIVTINGGEYYAYTGSSTSISAVVGQSGANAVSILYGVNAPTSARSGFYQKNCIYQMTGGGMVNCTDIITTLPMQVVSGSSNIRGTISMNKPNAM